MGNAVKALGWVIAVVATVAVVVLAGQLRQAREDLAAAHSARKTLEPQAAASASAKDELTQAQAEVEQLTQDLAVAKAEAARLKTVAEEAPPEAPPAELADEAAEETETPESGPSGREQRMLETQMGMMVDMAYKTFFDEQALPPDVHDQVRSFLAESFAARQREAAAAMKAKDKTAKEVQALEDQAIEQLRGKLAQVLSADELAAWDAYRGYEDQYLYETLIDGQLNMMAPGLTAENRATVKILMAEDLAAQLGAFEQSDEIYSRDSFNRNQSQALHTSLERLTQVLDEEQYAHVEGFVAQVDAMFDAMAE